MPALTDPQLLDIFKTAAEKTDPAHAPTLEKLWSLVHTEFEKNVGFSVAGTDRTFISIAAANSLKHESLYIRALGDGTFNVELSQYNPSREVSSAAAQSAEQVMKALGDFYGAHKKTPASPEKTQKIRPPYKGYL